VNIRKEHTNSGGFNLRYVKKWLFVNFILIIIIPSFAGCSVEANKQKVQTSTIAYSKIQKIRVALWDYDTVEYDKKLIEAFTKKYPNIQVEVISFPSDQYDKKLAVKLEGESDIDVFYAQTEERVVNLSLNKQVKDIDKLIARDKINLSQYNKIDKINNKIYGVPYRSDFRVLYYNKDIFDKNKIPYPTNDMTWEEYRNLGKRLTSVNKKNKTYGIFMLPLYLAQQNLQGEKFDFIKDDLNMLKPGIKLLMNIQMVDKSAVDYGTNKSLNANQLTFEKGDSAMFIYGTWFINYLAKDKERGKFNFNWGMAKIPHWKDEEQSDAIINTSVCINAKTTKLEAAWAFEKFITGEEGAQILAKEMILPGHIDNGILSEFNKNPGLSKDSGAVFRTNKTTNYEVASAVKYQVSNMVFEEVENILMKKKSIDQGISDMMKRRKEIQNKNK